MGNLSYYQFHDRKDLCELISLHGFHPKQITDVILSHLHFDHCGGCTYRDKDGNLQITFPDATHWVSEWQWKNYLHPNDLEKDAFRPEDMMPVFDAGLIRRIDSDFEPFENFYFIACSTATATATDAPTIGLLPMPRKPIISTWAGTELDPANCASECMRPIVSVMP